MNYKKSLRFPFLGEGWFMNFFISFCFTMTYFSVAVFPGYSIQILKDFLAADDREITMPNWNNLGRYLKDSIYLFVIQIVYRLPISILYGCFITYYMFYLYPIYHLEGLLYNKFLYVLVISSVLYSIFLAGFIPTIYGRYAETGQLMEALNIKTIFFLTKKHFWKNIYAMIVLSLMTLFALPFALFIGLLTFGIGINIFITYITMVSYHIIAQLYQSTLIANKKNQLHEYPPSIHVEN